MTASYTASGKAGDLRSLSGGVRRPPPSAPRSARGSRARRGSPDSAGCPTEGLHTLNSLPTLTHPIRSSPARGLLEQLCDLCVAILECSIHRRLLRIVAMVDIGAILQQPLDHSHVTHSGGPEQ